MTGILSPMAMKKEDAQYIELALTIATEVHKGQCDKNGVPYILHPIRMSMKQNTPERVIVALLHDVLEDGKNPASLRREIYTFFGTDTLMTIEALTHHKPKYEETYEQYIDRIIAHCRESGNNDAAWVKLTDIEDNSNIRRTTASGQKIPVYINAYRRICTHLGVNPTLSIFFPLQP